MAQLILTRFASKLFLEEFDMVDTCHMNTLEGVWRPIHYKICELTVQRFPVKCRCPQQPTYKNI